MFKKDLRIEARTKELVATAGFFAVLVCVLSSIAFLADDTTAPGAVWLPVAFACVLGLSRSWQREREDGALTALLLAPIPRAAIFAGKALGIFAFLLVVMGLLVPTVGLLFHLDLGGKLGGLALLCILGALGAAGIGTLFGVMTVRTRARDLLLSVILLPMLAPVLLTGISGTHAALGGASLGELQDYFLLLLTFDFLAVGGGLALFGFLVDE